MTKQVAAPSVTAPLNNHSKPRVCFSFAAYARNIIEDLKAAEVPVAPGLSDSDFSEIESVFNIKFPPDFRSFLQEGLPLSPGFTNWRNSSAQQLQILINLPILGLLKEVSKNQFWAQSWPTKPDNIDDALNLAKILLQKAPVLLPVYRYCYIPCTPNIAGNPVFYINGGEIRILSFDLTGFFHQVDFKVSDSVVNRRPSLSSLFNLPAWAATEAKSIDFWTLAACRQGMVAHGRSPVVHGWWSRDMAGCMEGVWGRLRDGGWKEEEVKEMMMIMDGGNCFDEVMNTRDCLGKDEVEGHVRGLSTRLLHAGWSKDEVADSLGVESDTEPTSWLEFQHTSSCMLEVI